MVWARRERARRGPVEDSAQGIVLPHLCNQALPTDGEVDRVCVA